MRMKKLGLLHKTISGDHEAQAEHCRKVAGHFGKLAEGMTKVDDSEAVSDAKGTLEALAAQYDQHANDHAERAAHHNECAEECLKLDAVEFEKTDQVIVGPSRVAPERPSITPVPRSGQPTFEKKTVPTQFQQLVRIEDDEF